MNETCHILGEFEDNYDIPCDNLQYMLDKVYSYSLSKSRAGTLRRATWQPQGGDDFRIHVFGGSVSCAAGVLKGYGELVREMISTLTGARVKVINYCTPASGPYLITGAVECGLDPCADLIISEFAINSQDSQQYDAWYRLLRDRCPRAQLLVLSLWSWLSGGPIRGGDESSVTTLLNLPRWTSDVFVLDFHQAAKDHWPYFRPFIPKDLFNHSTPQPTDGTKVEGPLPADVCSGPDLQSGCVECCMSSLQHGNFLYHQLVALSVTYTYLMGIPSQHSMVFQETTLQDNASTDGELVSLAPTRCYGAWGWRLELLPKSTNSFLSHISALVDGHPPKGWFIGDPFNRNVWKDSLYTRQLGACFTTKLPPHTTKLRLGWVAHSAMDEVTNFTVSIGHSDTKLSTMCEHEGVVRVAFAKDFSVIESEAQTDVGICLTSTSQSDTPFEIIKFAY